MACTHILERALRATNNLPDYLLTTQPLNSNAVQARLAASGHAGFTPYAGFPATNSLTQRALPVSAVRWYSQMPTPRPAIPSTTPLQIKATKRFSHGLQAGGTYTWGQGFVGPDRQNFFNPQSACGNSSKFPRRI